MDTETLAPAATPEAVPEHVASETKNTEQNTPSVTATEGVVETKQEEPKPKTFTQAEVDALVQKRLMKEQRRMNRQLSERIQNTPATAPVREQFQNDDAYWEAHIEHLAEQKAAQKVAERERTMQSEKRADVFAEKAEKAIEKYADFNDVVSNPNLHINDSMVEFITDSDLGTEVAYFLGKNPSRAEQIANMSPVKAALAMEAIAKEITAKPNPRPSSAPAPIKPIGASSSSQKDPEDMSFKEFTDWRRKHLSNSR